MDNNEMFSFYKAALQGAITSPLCADYKNEWRGCGNDKDKLVKLVMRQQSLPYFITHCYNGNTKDICRLHQRKHQKGRYF